MNHPTQHCTLALVALAALCNANANASESEWRVLGPAFSYHTSKTGAYASSTEQWSCFVANKTAVSGDPFNSFGLNSSNGYANFTATDVNAGKASGAVASALGGSGTGHFDSMGNGSHHYVAMSQPTTIGTVTAPNGRVLEVQSYRYAECTANGYSVDKKWHQLNPALGLSYSVRDAGHVDQVFATIVRDSYGKSGLMTGAGRLWTLGSAVGVTVDAGVIGGLWYRTNLDLTTNTLHRAIVPYALPALSVTHESTGLGLNLAVASKVQMNGRLYNPTTTFMAQTTWRFKKDSASSEPGVKSVSLESTGLAVQVKVSAVF